MVNYRKRAIVLILIAAFVPLLLIPFLSGYKAGAGWFSNLMNLKIALGSRLYIPYRFVLGVAILFIFIGVRQLDFSRPEK
jgi:hypothetical protein